MPDLVVTHRLAVVPTLLLPLLTASLSVAPLAFSASSASPGNVLATILLEPPPSLSATVPGDGTVDLAWDTSPSAASRAVEYVVLRRQVGASVFAPIARTSAVSYTDAPPPSTFDYVVRSAISSFSSTDSPVATASTSP